MDLFILVDLVYLDSELAHFCGQHNTRATLDQFINVNDVILVSIVVNDMAWGIWFFDPGTLHEQKKSVAINDAHYTSLKGQFYIFHKPKIFITLLLSLLNEHSAKSSSSPSMALSAFSTFFMAILLYQTVLTRMPHLTVMVAHFIKFSVSIFIFFCFLVIFFFFIITFRVCSVARFVAILSTFPALLFILFIIHTQHLFFSNFFFFFTFDFLLPVIQFFTNWINSQGIIPSCCKGIFKPIKDYVIFLGQII